MALDSLCDSAKRIPCDPRLSTSKAASAALHFCFLCTEGRGPKRTAPPLRGTSGARPGGGMNCCSELGTLASPGNRWHLVLRLRSCHMGRSQIKALDGPGLEGPRAKSTAGTAEPLERALLPGPCLASLQSLFSCLFPLDHGNYLSHSGRLGSLGSRFIPPTGLNFMSPPTPAAMGPQCTCLHG